MGYMAFSVACIDQIVVSAYTIPTDAPEADGTLEWNSTALVLIEIRTGDVVGLGYTYGNAAIARTAKCDGCPRPADAPVTTISRFPLLAIYSFPTFICMISMLRSHLLII